MIEAERSHAGDTGLDPEETKALNLRTSSKRWCKGFLEGGRQAFKGPARTWGVMSLEMTPTTIIDPSPVFRMHTSPKASP